MRDLVKIKGVENEPDYFTKKRKIKMSTKEQDLTIIKIKHFVDFGNRNKAKRFVEISRFDAAALHGFLANYVRGDQERQNLLSDFCGTADIGSDVMGLEISRREINRIAEIFQFRVEEEEQLHVEVDLVRRAPVHLDEVFLFSGGDPSWAFRKRMAELSGMLEVSK